MLLIAIDTATPLTSVALVDADRVLATRQALDGRRTAELLAGQLAELLALAPGPVAGVAAGVGPGPFTGLRVGLVSAAVLSDALGVPSYGVCSLDALAAAHEPPVTVVTDARRHEVYWASYDATGRRCAGPAVDRPTQLAASLPPGSRVAGAGALAYRVLFGAARLAEGEPYPTAAAVAALAMPRALAGAAGEALTPLYLRRPDAVPPAGMVPPGGIESPDELVVRAMQPADLPAVLAIERAVFGAEAWSEALFRSELEQEAAARSYLVALAGADLVGYAGLCVYPEDAWVQTLAVQPDRWGRGIGRRLLTALLEHAAQRGRAVIGLEVRADNSRAQQLYRRHGFVEIARRRGYYQPSNVDALVMRREGSG